MKDLILDQDKDHGGSVVCIMVGGSVPKCQQAFLKKYFTSQKLRCTSNSIPLRCASGSEQDAIEVIEYSSDEDCEVEGAGVAAGACEAQGGD